MQYLSKITKCLTNFAIKNDYIIYKNKLTSIIRKHTQAVEISTKNIKEIKYKDNSVNIFKENKSSEKWKIGDIKYNFKLESIEIFEEYKINIYILQHVVTKTKYIHLQRDDDDTAFCIGFPTLPKNDKGIAHILEHTVQCGSINYPIRDPFFNQYRRSQNTFMNAITRSECTYYIFSSINSKDQYNLLSMYLDAVFFPLLRKNDFYQEGYRIELIENKKDSDELIYKGIVLNEMNGVLSDNISYFMYILNKNLYNKSIYKYENGGIPEHIVELEYNELIEYYKEYYKPSLATLLSYGNNISNTILQLCDKVLYERYNIDLKNNINNDNTINIKNKLIENDRYDKPIDVICYGPEINNILLDTKKTTRFALTWLCRTIRITDITEKSQINKDILYMYDQRINYGIDNSYIYNSIPYKHILSDNYIYINNDNIYTLYNSNILKNDNIIEENNIINKKWENLQKYISTLNEKERKDCEIMLEDISLQILSIQLLEQPTSPLYKQLNDTKLSIGPLLCNGIDITKYEPTFTIGSQGIYIDDIYKITYEINKLQIDICKDVVLMKEIFSIDKINAQQKQIEYRIKDVSSNYGIELQQKLIPICTNNIIPIKVPFEIQRIQDIFECTTNFYGPQYWITLLVYHILSNPHRLQLIMISKDNFIENKQLIERNKLLQQYKNLNIDKKKEQLNKQKEQYKYQEINDKDNIIKYQPSLTIDDINIYSRKYTFNKIYNNITLNNQSTNDIIILRYIIDTTYNRQNINDLYWQPIQCEQFGKIGTLDREYYDIIHMIESKTGGITMSLQVDIDNSSVNIEPSIHTIFTQKTLKDTFVENIDLQINLCTRIDYTKHVDILLIQYYNIQQNQLLENPIHFAILNASSKLLRNRSIENIQYGIPNLLFLSTYIKNINNDSIDNKYKTLYYICNKLCTIWYKLQGENNKSIKYIKEDNKKILESINILPSLFDRILITCNPECNDIISTNINKFILDDKKLYIRGFNEENNLYSIDTITTTNNIILKSLNKKNCYIGIETQVYTVVMCMYTRRNKTIEYAPQLLLAEIISQQYLHINIREKGGAYGSFASQCRDGIFILGSYRDPNCINTINIFKESLEWCKDINNQNDSILLEAKLTIFQSIDAPESPSDSGVDSFIRNISLEERQHLRNELLCIKANDIVVTAKNVFTDKVVMDSSITVIGPYICEETLPYDWERVMLNVI